MNEFVVGVSAGKPAVCRAPWTEEADADAEAEAGIKQPACWPLRLRLQGYMSVTVKRKR